jgi:hypothetical protein
MEDLFSETKKNMLLAQFLGNKKAETIKFRL